jgi:hypothetical protein
VFLPLKEGWAKIDFQNTIAINAQKSAFSIEDNGVLAIKKSKDRFVSTWNIRSSSSKIIVNRFWFCHSLYLFDYCFILLLPRMDNNSMKIDIILLS